MTTHQPTHDGSSQPDRNKSSGNLAGGSVELYELISALWSSRWFIIGVTTVFTVGAIIFALSLPDKYQADALLAPAEEAEGGGISALANQFGGLASLAGVKVPADSADKVTIAMEILKSREFIREFINRYDLLVPLMAVSGWSRESGDLIYDPSIYDVEAKEWVREVKPPRKPTPSHLEAYKVFRDSLAINRDGKTGLIVVSMEHYSPLLAKTWVDRLVLDINRTVREREVKEAEDSIRFLNQQLERTAAPDMKRVFYHLIEEQTKTIMLSAVRAEYVFKTVDPAVIPEEASSPHRAFIVMAAILIGSLLATLLVLLRRAMRPLA